ncbi:hypothetical protein [Pantoea dispersa]|uniref:hypothetical protein n=1 Tax=Pantoea dispersa TaxID=59814 RepID=UPI0032156990
MFSSLEPLEQVYIGEIKKAFDLWLDVLHAKPPTEPTALQKMFLDEPIPSLEKIDKPLVYDISFNFIFKG